MKMHYLPIIVGIICVIGFSSILHIEAETIGTVSYTSHSKIIFGIPINLSNYGYSRNPQISVSGNDVYVTWIHFSPEVGTYFRKSTDGGVTFTDPVKISNSTDSQQTHTPVQKEYKVWYDQTPNQIFVGKLNDNGTLVKTQVSNITWGLNPYAELPKPQIAVSYPNVYVVWKYTAWPNGNDAAFFVASIDGGKTFDSPIKLSQGGTYEDPLVVSSGNNVYVVWTEGSPTSVFLIKGTSPQMPSEIGSSKTENNNEFSFSKIFGDLIKWFQQYFHWMIL